MTIKVDPGHDDTMPPGETGNNNGAAVDDDDSDDDSFSGMSGLSEGDDEVPFGPSRNGGGGEGGLPSKGLELLRRISYHGGAAPPGV